MKKKAAVVPKGKVEKKVQVPAAGPHTLTSIYLSFPYCLLSILLVVEKSVKLRICDMAFVEEAQASSIVLAGLGT